MTGAKHPSDDEARCDDLRLAINEARRRRDEARRRRDRTIVLRTRHDVPVHVHVLVTAGLTAAFALSGLVVAWAYVDGFQMPCEVYPRVKVRAVWALAVWVSTALVWAWLRRRRRRPLALSRPP